MYPNSIKVFREVIIGNELMFEWFGVRNENLIVEEVISEVELEYRLSQNN